MFHIVNCAEMPTAYMKGNYTPIRATSSKLPTISNKLAPRSIGSLQNDRRLPRNDYKEIKRLHTKKCG